jgi:signal transduction histidine kinase
LSCLSGRAPVPVRLAVPPQRLPAIIETAVYFICSEALTNVGKYASASRIDVAVRVDADLVIVLIADDGVGGADPSAGSGLRGVADRVETLGGRFLVDSPAGKGTRLVAEIPAAVRR